MKSLILLAPLVATFPAVTWAQSSPSWNIMPSSTGASYAAVRFFDPVTAIPVDLIDSATSYNGTPDSRQMNARVSVVGTNSTGIVQASASLLEFFSDDGMQASSSLSIMSGVTDEYHLANAYANSGFFFELNEPAKVKLLIDNWIHYPEFEDSFQGYGIEVVLRETTGAFEETYANFYWWYGPSDTVTIQTTPLFGGTGSLDVDLSAGTYHLGYSITMAMSQYYWVGADLDSVSQQQSARIRFEISAIPEPSTHTAIFGSMVLGLVMAWRRRFAPTLLRYLRGDPGTSDTSIPVK